VLAPQPRGEWILFFDRSLLLQSPVAADRCVYQPCSDYGEDQTEHDAENPAPASKISAACELRIDEEEPRTQKGEAKKSEEERSALGRLGHTLIVESQGRSKRTSSSGLFLRLLILSTQ